MSMTEIAAAPNSEPNVFRSGEPLRWEDPAWSPAGLSAKARELSPYLLAVSRVLFQKAGLEPHFLSRVDALLKKYKNGAQVLGEVQKGFAEGRQVSAAGQSFSPERLENTFTTYSALKQGGEALEKKKQAMEQELLLSRLFTPRQKTLLRKKLEGGLSKTEREYYSRVLKKRLQTVSDEELHALAKKLLGK